MKSCVPKKLSIRVVTGSVLLGALIGTAAFLLEMAVAKEFMKSTSSAVGGMHEFDTQMAAVGVADAADAISALDAK